jgi:hypothetical protein
LQLSITRNTSGGELWEAGQALERALRAKNGIIAVYSFAEGIAYRRPSRVAPEFQLIGFV